MRQGEANLKEMAMTITTFDFIILMGAVCGLIMVVGSMGLLYKGIVQLNAVSPQDAITVEFRKTVRITSHYPAIALFIIGFCFMGVAGYEAYNNNEIAKPVRLNGSITGAADPDSVKIYISAGPWSLDPTSNGKADDIKVDDFIYPDLKLLKVEVTAAGCNSWSTKIPLKSGTISLGEMKLIKLIDRATIGSNQIVDASVSLAPRTAQGSF